MKNLLALVLLLSMGSSLIVDAATPPMLGSYAETCSNCSITTVTSKTGGQVSQLNCTCNNAAGKPQAASLLIPDVSNQNGVLTMAPYGTYLEKCSNCSVSNNTLNCTCQNFLNQPVKATLPLQDINTVNGVLQYMKP
jgi:Fe-S cluster biogenesis protein NfuA